MTRGRKPTTYDNKTVARWLISTKYKNLDVSIKAKLPAFVDDTVYGGLYIFRDNDTQSNTLAIKPSVIYMCLMMDEISTTSVRIACEDRGLYYSERTYRRICQISRFVSKGIESRIHQYEEMQELSTDKKGYDWKLEQQFLWCYLNGKESKLYSAPLPPLPQNILTLYLNKQYAEYGRAVQEYRSCQPFHLDLITVT